MSTKQDRPISRSLRWLLHVALIAVTPKRGAGRWRVSIEPYRYDVPVYQHERIAKNSNAWRVGYRVRVWRYWVRLHRHEVTPKRKTNG